MIPHRRQPFRVAAVLALLLCAAISPDLSAASQRRASAHKVCVAARPAKGRHAKKPASRAGSCVSAKKGKRTPVRGRTPRGLEATPIGAGAPSTGEGTGGEGGGAAPPAGTEGKSKPTGTLPQDSGETVTDPIDPRYLTADPFGTTSFWIQPWRAYMDTWPASRLLGAVGINFNVSKEDAEPTAQLLQDSGFKLARVPINWSALSYEDPTQFIPSRLTSIVDRLTALHNHGLRPLIVLDAYAGSPAPEKPIKLETTTEAPAGAQTVTLTPESAALVVPGKSGFNSLAFNGTPDILITSVSPSGVATLSKALSAPLAAGAHAGTTLLYGPFESPKLANGEPNPEFQATMAGWLNYVAMVSKEAASIVGPGGFDLEIWNELTFGSQFLNIENYYTPGTAPAARSMSVSQPAAASAGQGSEAEETETEPGFSSNSETDYASEAANPTEAEEAPEAEGTGIEGEGVEPAAMARPNAAKSHKKQVNKEVMKAILDETVAFVRNPANGIAPAVGITNGFASETPFPSGAAAPIGLTALSKHPYVNARSFPAEYKERHDFPLNALGTRDTLKGSFAPLFIPAYQALLPEYTLTDTSTETLVRDLAPFTTTIYHFPHGRNVGPAGGVPVQKWITEYNLGSDGKATVVEPDGVTPASGPAATLSTADRAHFEAKAILRSLVAMVNKGMSREYFFAAGPGALSLIGNGFFNELEAHPGKYPGDAAGGETMSAMRDMLAHFEGPGPSGEARQLKLLSITQNGNHAQFAGDGTTPHPSLYDRDVLAVLPFQSSPTHYVIPVYVMTRDMLTLYQPLGSPSDVTRFDLPDETFKITLGNLPETTTPPTVSSYDPIRHASTPARLLSREGSTAVFEVSATDYPRLLNIEYTGA